MEFKKPYNSYNNNYNRSNNGRNNYYDRNQKRDMGPRKNEFIRITPVVVIDDEGNNLGTMDTYAALNLAREKGLDLVEVGSTVRPPVCKIMDYSKFVYEQSKKQKKSKVANKEMKEFKFSPFIEQNDIDMRVRRTKEYLAKGHNVRLTMVRKGRQTIEQAKETFEKILTNFPDYSTIEPDKKFEGKTIFITFKANGKTKNKENSSKES
ncbi:MAG TPA: translation initiation factor IF-3 [Candidatus Dojkabacteria bacterium]|nr:translation initiation factor IF-3 [Candidatus Dojkabacteria bacterium]